MENHEQHPQHELSGEDKALAAVAYLGPLSLLSLAIGKTPFVKFHAKQGLALFLVALVVRIVLSILTALFWPGYTYGYGMHVMGGGFLMSIWHLLVFIAAVAGIVKAVGGEQWEMPVVSDIAKKF